MNVAVVYHSAAAYREPLFKLLFSKDDLPIKFTLFSGRSSNESTIRLMDTGLGSPPTGNGRLNWHLIRNFWLGQFLFQPYVLLLPWQRKWDCVIFLGNPYYITTWFSALLCRLRGKKILMWTHGYRALERSRIKRLFKNCFYKLADGLVLYGERAKDILNQEGFDPKCLFVAYNSAPGVPAPTPLLAQNSNFLSFKHAAPTIIWVGRMTPAKELSLLVEAVNKLHAAGTLCNVVLIGNGPERSNIIQQVAARKLDDYFHLPGAIHDTTKLSAYLNSAHVAVSPGAIGLFAILAHGYGLPVITNDNFATQGPEVEIILDNETGSFFSENDSDALANALGDWLSIPTKRRRAKALCVERVTKCYTPEAQLQVLMRAVDAVCDKPYSEK
jgi:glycosyltransferase involved in cell wall biosynthesis